MDMPVPSPPRTKIDLLNRIAEALGIQDFAFSDPAMDTKIDALVELLQLWEAMPSGPARNRLLSAAKREVVRHGSSWGLNSTETLALDVATDSPGGTAVSMPDPPTLTALTFTLESIAKALGLPLAMFSDPAMIRALDGNAELNRLWEIMDCEASRQAVLNVARVLADAQRV